MQDTLELFTASSGKPSARVVLPDQTSRHIHSTVKPEAEADYFQSLHFWGDIIIFAGIGLGYHLSEKISQIPPAALVIILDYFDEFISNAINNSFSSLPNKVYTLSESTYQQNRQQIQTILKNNRTSLIQIIKHPASFDIHRGFYDAVLSDICSAPHQTPAKKTRAQNVLLLYGRFFLQEECRRAFTEINKDAPPLFHYETPASMPEYESLLQKTIQKEKPDFILSINMKGFDGSGTLPETASRYGLPLVVWFVDDPHPILLQQKQFISNRMTALCWEKAYIPYLKACGFGSVEYLPLAADPALFSASGPVSPTIPLGFVGTSMSGEYLAHIKTSFLWSDNLVPLVDKASEELLADPPKKISAVIHKAIDELSINLPFTDERNFTWLCSYIIHTASMKKRKATLMPLLSCGIELFGDPDGWRELLGTTCVTHPAVDYNHQLCTTYRSIMVNLNITSCQMPSAVNQRIFDIPLSGSFVISDNQPDCAELFETGKEIIIYKNIAELKDILEYYKKSASGRSSIVDAAIKRIREQHTYYHRIQSMLQLLD